MRVFQTIFISATTSGTKFRSISISVAEELDEKANEINNAPDHAQMFKAVKSLNRKRYENPKIFDEQEKIITSTKQIQQVIYEHFKTKFRHNDVENIEPFIDNARGLNHPITCGEVTEALG